MCFKVLNVSNETNTLKEVVLGIAHNIGDIPSLEDVYDPKSAFHIKQGTYPKKVDMIEEIDEFEQVLQKYKVKVHRPSNIPKLNQIFTRDIGFVIEDKFIYSNILPLRKKEQDSLKEILENVNSNSIVYPSKQVHIEGGDVILWNDYIFIGTYYGKDYSNFITARTNRYGVNFIKELYPNKKVLDFELVKSNTDPYHNALHLDCCFQPVGKNLAVIHKEGFINATDVNLIVSLFGEKNILYVDAKEMYDMTCNFFSISPNVVVSDVRFERLNSWLEQHQILVEKINYKEIAKQEGLLRCSTLPLVRE